MAVGDSEVEIVKARCDKREYRRIVLPNYLEVLIISDPEADKAAASMNVAVGYFCDPEGLEGLAHFLDEMNKNVSLQLFAHFAKQAAFHQLRSVEQLGYITDLTLSNYYGVRGVLIIIQSAFKDPEYLEARVDAFLDMFGSKLHEMTNEEYKKNVNALIDIKLGKFKNLWEESDYYWGEISAGTFKFDRIDCAVAALRELNKEEMIDFFNQYIKVDAPKRKTLSVQVYGTPQAAEYQRVVQQEDAPKVNKIKDIFSFRKSRPLYGSLRGALR